MQTKLSGRDDEIKKVPTLQLQNSSSLYLGRLLVLKYRGNNSVDF